MKSILLYLEPNEAERQPMIQMAADLVEALTLRAEALEHPPESIGIVAEPFACLEIGLSMLGRGEARTVEGGERRASPLVLFPFVTDQTRESGEMLLMRRRETESEDYGTLDDLALFGAVEQHMELSFEGQTPRSAGEVLERVLSWRSWECIVVFAPMENAIERLASGSRIVNVRELGEGTGRIPELLARLERTEDEAVRAFQEAAVSGALRLEALLAQFETTNRSHLERTD